jgi:hypothetical protein
MQPTQPDKGVPTRKGSFSSSPCAVRTPFLFSALSYFHFGVRPMTDPLPSKLSRRRVLQAAAAGVVGLDPAASIRCQHCIPNTFDDTAHQRPRRGISH